VRRKPPVPLSLTTKPMNARVEVDHAVEVGGVHAKIA